METATAPPFASESERLARGESPAPSARRRAALDAALAAALPARAVHLWRYTDPSRLTPADREVAPARSELRSAPAEGSRSLPILDVHADRGLAPLLGSLSPAEGGHFDALSLALFSGGHAIDFAARARSAEAVHLAHLAPATAAAAFSRTLVRVGEGAEASLVESMESDSGTGGGLAHHLTELFLEPGARFVHTVVGVHGPGTRGLVVLRARLSRGSTLTTVTVGLGGEVLKTDITAVLAGEGARSEVLGATFGEARQHFDLHVFQDHAAPRTHSDLVVRTALRDRARSSYTGRLRIAVDAAGCEARQENRNLLLSPDARADSIPELEILTHEVHCAHAAATGPVDPEALFYLRSRGFDLAEAERTVVLGFLEPVLSRVPGEPLAASLRATALRRLGG